MNRDIILKINLNEETNSFHTEMNDQEGDLDGILLLKALESIQNQVINAIMEYGHVTKEEIRNQLDQIAVTELPKWSDN